MLDESTRQAYLNAMGVTQWQLPSEDVSSEELASEQLSSVQLSSVQVSSSQVPSQKAVEQVRTKLAENKLSEVKQETQPADLKVDSPAKVESLPMINGLKWLNQGSKNGLLVVLAEGRKSLSNEGRALMSKMLKGIQFLPAETGFAISGEKVNAAQDFTLKDIKAILVFGNDAGRELVRFSGAKIIPGTEYFSLENCKVVITLHPDELLSHPEHKQQAWNDLKQLVHFFNND